ncbi:DoxX family protein [Mycobacterium sp. Marseille-P9652]|uniref:DoxX family protein n=1 Tax=Mycobacterium sp. Marseille-P9652 TaxID=2654950 RepID=UPI0012E7FECD|nr:DoxX family protein [Mycobacterium sp. Marseille-P9652]
MSARPQGRAAAAIGTLFVLHGLLFVLQPLKIRGRLAEGPLSPAQFRLLGIAETAGGAVVSLGAVSRVVPRALSIPANGGILAVLVCATLLHLRRREIPTAIGTAVGAAVSASLVRSAAR